jgi:hypothetical protein
MVSINISGSGCGLGCNHTKAKNKSNIIIAPVLVISCMADYFWSEHLGAYVLVYACGLPSELFLPLLNLSIEVKPSVKITTHSTASTNSLLGAMSWCVVLLYASVP